MNRDVLSVSLRITGLAQITGIDVRDQVTLLCRPRATIRPRRRSNRPLHVTGPQADIAADDERVRPVTPADRYLLTTATLMPTGFKAGRPGGPISDRLFPKATIPCETQGRFAVYQRHDTVWKT